MSSYLIDSFEVTWHPVREINKKHMYSHTGWESLFHMYNSRYSKMSAFFFCLVVLTMKLHFFFVSWSDTDVNLKHGISFCSWQDSCDAILWFVWMLLPLCYLAVEDYKQIKKYLKPNASFPWVNITRMPNFLINEGLLPLFVLVLYSELVIMFVFPHL